MPSNIDLGLRNNNPGNIRYNGIQWQGLLGKNKGFCVFDTCLNGTRAIAKIWKVYFLVDGVKSLRDGITRYAPPSENNVDAYLNALCTETGLGPDDIITPSLEIVRNIIAAIIRHENGDAMFTFYLNERGGYNTIDQAIYNAGWSFENVA